MTTSGISNLVNNATSSTLPSTQASTQSLKDEFLQLLLAQLKNQDPSQPVDDTQMVAEQAQFASLEQMQNLNTNLVSMMAMQAVTQSTGLIGKTVTGLDTNGNTVTGLVSSVQFTGGNPFLNIGNVQISPSSVTNVSS